MSMCGGEPGQPLDANPRSMFGEKVESEFASTNVIDWHKLSSMAETLVLPRI